MALGCLLPDYTILFFGCNGWSNSGDGRNEKLIRISLVVTSCEIVDDDDDDQVGCVAVPKLPNVDYLFFHFSFHFRFCIVLVISPLYMRVYARMFTERR